MNSEKSDEEIEDELKEAGWKKDQIDYAMKKVKKESKKFQRITIMNFIKSERLKGKSDEEIEDELKEAGWAEKMIKYGFKAIKKEEKKRKI